MSSKADIANAIAGAKTFEKGERVRPGIYEYSLEKFQIKTGGYKGDSIVVELRVDKSEACEPNVTPNPVGSIVSVVWNATKNREMALANAKAFALAVTNLTEDQLVKQQAALDARCAAEGKAPFSLLGTWITKASNLGEQEGLAVQPMRGSKVRASTVQIETDNSKGKPRSEWFCAVNFKPMPGANTPDAVAANRARLDATTPVAAAAPAAPPPPPVQPPPAPAADLGGDFLNGLM
jgi:hypothetical protein